MAFKHEKTPAGAGNTNEGANETGTGSNKTNHSSRELRLTIGKVQAAISDNTRILRKINEKAITASPTEFQELDAMKATDDLDLERAGLSSWGEGDE